MVKAKKANKVKRGIKVEDNMIRINNRVPGEIYEKLRKQQYETRESMNSQVIRFIRDGLEIEATGLKCNAQSSMKNKMELSKRQIKKQSYNSTSELETAVIELRAEIGERAFNEVKTFLEANRNLGYGNLNLAIVTDMTSQLTEELQSAIINLQTRLGEEAFIHYRKWLNANNKFGYRNLNIAITRCELNS